MTSNQHSSFNVKQFTIINCQLLLIILLVSCSVHHRIAATASKILLSDSAVSTGDIGISIYEPSTNKYWYNYNATKYFVPASNTKLFTLYAGMKYLGDSLVGLKYTETDTSITILPTGDPTFLQDDFEIQPILNFLKKEKRKIYITTNNWQENALGKGWAWDDYNNSYMAERSPFPIVGNVVTFNLSNYGMSSVPFSLSFKPLFFEKQNTDFFIKIINEISDFNIVKTSTNSFPKLSVQRDEKCNQFKLVNATAPFLNQQVPFCTDTISTAQKILREDYAVNLIVNNNYIFNSLHSAVIHSQPTDSLFKPMMYNSDNFFAEQTLLMASNERLGYMNEEKMIDTLLKTALKDVPQKPKWVDGSGLSRYNLFTPQDFVFIINKIKIEFGITRLKLILPTGGEGSLKNYYLKDSCFIYAKTGTLSNNNALSGFIITKQNKCLIFSILVNNFQGAGMPVKKAIEKFLEAIRNNY